MGSDVHLVIEGPEALLTVSRDRIAGLEARWSRFLPTSEVSRLNAAGGALTVVSADTFGLVERALEAWRATDGRYDPTVLGDVVRAGYDASFDVLPADRAAAPLSGLHAGAAGIVTFPAAGALSLPPGVGLDPGGIGKGLAADIVAGELFDAGAEGVCVNIGGDLRVLGRLDGDARWVVAVDPAADGRRVATVALGDGAVATTTVTRRTWRIGGVAAHHLIDPTTGRAPQAGVASVTVVAGQCWRAEALAKAVIVAGIDEGTALVEAAGAASVIVDVGARVHRSARMADYLVEEVPA